MLGVGVIGCGAISKMHIESFLRIPQTKIRAVADVNEAAAAHVANELGAASYTDYHELLKRTDIDLVSICTPSGLHSEAAIAAARAGKHVIVEKPLDVTLPKIDAMIEACEQNHVKLNCIFNNRYRESNLFLKRAVEAGRFGKLVNANAIIRWYREPDYYIKSPWHGSWALDGGGALMNQSIHYVDLLLWLAGSVESLSAYTGTLLHKSMETEDTAVVSLRFLNGALGAIIATTSTYPGYPAEIQITGERGSASVLDGVIERWKFADSDPLDKEAEAFFGSGKVDNARASIPMAFACEYHAKQIRRAIESIENDTVPDIGGAEARKSVELILGIYESAKTGRQVRF
ncbi:MAG: Gfo/Idh/MocA family oxidoreductase [Clostridiaceae bacterium]